MKLYQVSTIVEKDAKSMTKMDSFYVAENINKIIKELELDLQDKATEVIGIHEIAPVLKILS